MKRSFLLVFLLWISIGGGVIAQNRSIRFEPKDWKKAVEKAHFSGLSYLLVRAL